MRTVHNKSRQTTANEVLKLRAKTTTNQQVGTLKLSLVRDDNGYQTQWGWKGYLVLASDFSVICKVSWGKQGRSLIRLIDNQYHSNRGALWETTKTGTVTIVNDTLLSADMIKEIKSLSNETVTVLNGSRPKGRLRKVKKW